MTVIGNILNDNLVMQIYRFTALSIYMCIPWYKKKISGNLYEEGWH